MWRCCWSRSWNFRWLQAYCQVNIYIYILDKKKKKKIINYGLWIIIDIKCTSNILITFILLLLLLFFPLLLFNRAFHRIGNAYNKKGDFDSAIKYYNKSLAEHRTPQVLEVLRKTEKEKAEAAKLAYHDVAKADEARNQGNVLFKEGKYSEAVKFYTEAIKRNEDDPRNWNNRATCYIKLMAISEAEKDADECIKRDPNFLKAYIRKAQVYLAKRETSKAVDMLNFVRERDTDKKLEAEVQQQMMKCYGSINQTQNNATDEEIMNNVRNNPEVAQILSDPIMRSILEQMQNDPNAINDHLKNPTVAAKIRTLIDAGIIRIK